MVVFEIGVVYRKHKMEVDAVSEVTSRHLTPGGCWSIVITVSLTLFATFYSGTTRTTEIQLCLWVHLIGKSAVLK